MPVTEPTRNETIRAYDLLGGAATIKEPVSNKLEAHDLLVKGLAPSALLHLIDGLHWLPAGNTLDKAIGISIRTLQRRKKEQSPKALSVEQSNRTWTFAEILAQAIDVLGSKEEAELWLGRPAIGLENRRPIDLLESSAGAEAVENYLTRMEYGVYS